MENIEEKTNEFKRAMGIRLRALRKRAGFSSVEAASEAMDVHSNTVALLERGSTFLSAEMAVKIIEAYALPDASPLFADSVSALPATPEEALEILSEFIKTRNT